MKKDYKTIFLKKYLLKRSTNLAEQSEVLRACCVLAYADMLTAGKYLLYKRGVKNNGLREKIIKGFLYLLNKKKYCFSRELIDEVVPLFGNKGTIKIKKSNVFISAYGLAQKFVNMSFKYFFVFEDDLSKYKFDFSECDCPVDSVILKSLEKKWKHPWSKLEKDEYIEIQDTIKDKLSKDKRLGELPAIGLMAYDFLYW